MKRVFNLKQPAHADVVVIKAKWEKLAKLAQVPITAG